MPSFAGVHHVDLVVSSIERSLPFYRELLAPLGYHRVTEVEGERGETIWYLSGPGTAIGIRQAQSEDGPYDRYAVELESGPEEYHYLPGYYAVFFYDPDGLKLEIVHVPALAA